MEKILMCSFLLKFYLVNASTMRNYYRLSHSPGFCLFFTCCFFLRSVWYLFYSCLWCWAARCDCSPGANAPAFLALKYWKHFQSSLFWFPEYIAGSKLLTVCTVWTFFLLTTYLRCLSCFCTPPLIVECPFSSYESKYHLYLLSFSPSNQFFVHPFIVNFMHLLYSYITLKFFYWACWNN